MQNFPHIMAYSPGKKIIMQKSKVHACDRDHMQKSSCLSICSLTEFILHRIRQGPAHRGVKRKYMLSSARSNIGKK